MSKLETAPTAGFTPGERAYIRNELDMFFSTLPSVAEGFHLKTWRGGPDAGEAAARVTRIPPGHPEGYLEGFANIYSEVALAIKAARSGTKPPEGMHFPTIEDGVKGLAFVEAAVKSSKANGAWVKL